MHARPLCSDNARLPVPLLRIHWSLSYITYVQTFHRFAELSLIVGITRHPDKQLQEASMHVLCNCLSTDKAKAALPVRDAGGIAAAARLLSSDVADIQVRAHLFKAAAPVPRGSPAFACMGVKQHLYKCICTSTARIETCPDRQSTLR